MEAPAAARDLRRQCMGTSQGIRCLAEVRQPEGEGTLLSFAALPPPGGEALERVEGWWRRGCGWTAGTLFCWGPNVWGEVGDGTKLPRMLPVPVTGGHTWRR